MSANGDESFNVIAARTAVWHAAAAHIPAERDIVQWPVEGDDAARAIRLTQLCGDVMYAVLSGRTDLVEDLARVIACATLWAETLVQQ